MAIFKYTGTKEQLNNTEISDGNIYVCINPDENNEDFNIGEWYVDVHNKRYKIAAASLINIEKNAILVGNEPNLPAQSISSSKGAFYSEGNGIKPQYNTLPIDCGGTGGDNSETARNNLDVYSKLEINDKVTESTSSIFTININNNEWNLNSEQKFYCLKNLEGLYCGKNNNISPIIFLVYSQENKRKQIKNYNYIYKVDIIPQEGSVPSRITFFAYNKPDINLTLNIIDIK